MMVTSMPARSADDQAAFVALPVLGAINFTKFIPLSA